MNVVMFTNTFTPHVGGVARSVSSTASRLRARGHRVVVVASDFDGCADELDTIRVPSLTGVGTGGFSVHIPDVFDRAITMKLSGMIPDIVHSHHPFGLGDVALRFSRRSRCPIVFTYHTMYGEYVHHFVGEGNILSRTASNVVVKRSIDYSNGCSTVIAPSDDVRKYLKSGGVMVPVAAIPTGIDARLFCSGDRTRARAALGIGRSDGVIGYVGRLEPEKNLSFLSSAMSRIRDATGCRILIVGDGSFRARMECLLPGAVFTGSMSGIGLYDAYAAMDVFCFSSTTETQGMVVAEAVSSGAPVVALDAAGVRDVIRNGSNGYLVIDAESFVGAACKLLSTGIDRAMVRSTIDHLSADSTTSKLEELYYALCGLRAAVNSGGMRTMLELFRRRRRK